MNERYHHSSYDVIYHVNLKTNQALTGIEHVTSAMLH